MNMLSPMLEQVYNRSAFADVEGAPAGVNHAAFLLFAGFLWVLPVSHTVTAREIFFFSLLLITLWASWRNGLKLFMPMWLAWGVFASVSLLSLTYAIDPHYSLVEIKNEIVYSVLIMLIVASWVRNGRSLSRLVGILIIGNIVLAVLAVLLGGYLLMSFEKRVVSTPFDIGAGNFSTYIVLVVPFIAARSLLSLRQGVPAFILLSALLGLNLIALYLTDNRAAWLSIIAELILMAGLMWYHDMLPSGRKVALAAVVFVLALTLVFGIASFARHRKSKSFEETVGTITSGEVMTKLSKNSRLILWPAARKNIEDRPLSGGGFGRKAFGLLNPEISRMHRSFQHAHNVFLNKGVQMGIPGILAFCLLLWSAFREMVRPIRWGCADRDSVVFAIAGVAMLAGIIVKNFTDDFFVRDGAWMFWFMTAAIIGAFKNSNVEQPLRKGGRC